MICVNVIFIYCKDIFKITLEKLIKKTNAPGKVIRYCGRLYKLYLGLLFKKQRAKRVIQNNAFVSFITVYCI